MILSVQKFNIFISELLSIYLSIYLRYKLFPLYDFFLLRSSLLKPAMEEKSNLCGFLSILIFHLVIKPSAAAAPALELNRGFRANFDLSSGSFQPLLSDPTGIFSFGFLRINSSNLDLAVVHLPSNQSVWRAMAAQPGELSRSASLYFNGSLVFSDRETGVLWSSPAVSGDRVVLLNSSNLQIRKIAEPIVVLWQSFDFPSDTIVQNQNFTSNAALFSSNQRYSMRLGSNYLGLFMEFGGGVDEPMYWKRTALEAKNQIVAGDGPIYALLSPLGFLGLYQKENAPVDELSFDSFARGITGFRRLTLEADGNLRGYYWNGTIWVSDYKAISMLCELPSACGAYGLCSAEEKTCSCIDSRSEGCLEADSGNLCGSGNDDFWVLRRKGVDLANKELLGFIKVKSLNECEGLCERNCSCWGAVYNNGTGYCYRMEYPIQTVMEVGDENKIGFFKVRVTGNHGGGGNKGRKTAEALVAVGVLATAAVVGVVVYRWWRGRRRRGEGENGSMVEGLASGPYRDLNSWSFRSIELANSFRK
ncbi:PAN domain-containing protein At5g03700 [Phalaenopsis equestris]|uniref:PAN domain-containing protein At5g03700 n=1 Tax=Phalaenopsis equestris TaxID=78828 RepID=UPI0009E35D9B|nr:PAN domain-containing protein At5g03700 [Phalaenopsis equestris]